jgi:predicted hydrolase (HD superfamily)
MPEEMALALKSHNNHMTKLRNPETLLEWTLESCDELTGFIVAVTLVMPDKKLAVIDVDRVLKKFKQKEFARAVDRTQIASCEEKVKVPLQKFVEITLNAMKNNAEELGL